MKTDFVNAPARQVRKTPSVFDSKASIPLIASVVFTVVFILNFIYQHPIL